MGAIRRRRRRTTDSTHPLFGRSRTRRTVPRVPRRRAADVDHPGFSGVPRNRSYAASCGKYASEPTVHETGQRTRFEATPLEAAPRGFRAANEVRQSANEGSPERSECIEEPELLKAVAVEANHAARPDRPPPSNVARQRSAVGVRRQRRWTQEFFTGPTAVTGAMHERAGASQPRSSPATLDGARPSRCPSSERSQRPQASAGGFQAHGLRRARSVLAARGRLAGIRAPDPSCCTTC